MTLPTVPGITTAEDFIGYVARVSNPANQMNTETAPRLLSYLIKNHHWSPFEMVSLTVEIETTRDIARQILRHRSFSFQEFSQRYADPTNDLGFVRREARLQDAKNRQNSIDIDLDSDTKHLETSDNWDEIQREMIEQSLWAYRWAIDHGIAKEQARSVLPEGLTVSRIYMSGTLRSWIHYVQLRSANGTQKEHMEIAQDIRDSIIKVQFPSLREALEG